MRGTLKYTAMNKAVFPLIAAALLTACGSDPTKLGTGLSGGRDVLYFSTTTLSSAYLNEPYDAPVTVAGGVGPYNLRLASGTLPPGLTIKGMKLTGTPTKAGTYAFSLETTDANLSAKTQDYNLNITTLPPLAFKLQLPASDIRGETRLPLNITGPRGVRAARIEWQLPEHIKVSKVQLFESGGISFWKQEGQRLTLDLGFTNVPRNQARVALITVKTNSAVRLDDKVFGYEARDGSGKVIESKKLVVVAPKPATPATPGKTTTPDKDKATQPSTTPQTPAPAVPATGTTTPTQPVTPATTDPAAPNTPTPPTTGGQP